MNQSTRPITVAIGALPGNRHQMILQAPNRGNQFVTNTRVFNQPQNIRPPLDNANSNTISVNVSGQQLLKVEIPSLSSSSHVTGPSTNQSITGQSIEQSVPGQSINQSIISQSITKPVVSNLEILANSSVPTITSSNIQIAPVINQNLQNAILLNEVPIINNNASIEGKLNENASNVLHLQSINSTPIILENQLPITDGKINQPADQSLKLNENVNILSNKPHISNLGSLIDLGSTPVSVTDNMESFLYNASFGSNNDSSRIPQISTPSSVPEVNNTVPQIHIPELQTDMPMIDISLGGTVTVNDPQENIVLPEQLKSFGSQNISLSSSSCDIDNVLTTTAASSSSQFLSSNISGSHDNLFDITLANSNSDSCFSSKYKSHLIVLLV